MARPNKYDTHVAPRLCEVKDWARNGVSNKEIAKKLGISIDSFCLYQKKFSEFSEAIKNTREAVDGQVENALLQAALNGNTTAQIFWLKNRRPEQWRDKPEAQSAGNTVDRVEVIWENASESDDEATS